MNHNKKNAFEKVNILTRGALVAAIIFVMTSFLKLPTNTGYIHLGDAAVCLAAILFPQPLALIIAALGASLADLAAGYPMWILPTAIIKAAMTTSFSAKSEKFLSKRNVFAFFAAIIINALGYYLGGSIIYGNMTVSLMEIPTNLLQGAVGAVLCAILCAFLDANPRIKNIFRGKK